MGEGLKVTSITDMAASAVYIRNLPELPVALGALGLSSPCPTLVVVGGAAGMSPAHIAQLRPLFEDSLAPLAQALNAYVVDGGTNTGVMRLLGEARTHNRATFPLIGVAAIGTVALPDPISNSFSSNSSVVDRAELEPHHTHFLLVPGSQWGDEAPWISDVASILARERSSVTILINGGEGAWKDVANSIRAGRPVIVIANSGRTADVIANGLTGVEPSEQVQELASSDLLYLAGPDSCKVVELIKHILQMAE